MRLLALAAVLSVAIGSCSSAPLDDDGAGRASNLCGPPPVYHAIGTAVSFDQVAGDTVFTFSGITIPDGAAIVVGLTQDNYTADPGVARWNGQVSELVTSVGGTDMFQSLVLIKNVSGATGDLKISFDEPPLDAIALACYVTGVDPDPLDDFFQGTGVANSATDVNIEIFNFPSIFLAYVGSKESTAADPGAWSGTGGLTLGQRDGTSGATIDMVEVEGYGTKSSGFDWMNNYGPFSSSTEYVWTIVCLKACGNNPGGL